MIASWKKKARELQVQVYALACAYRDPRTPWYAKGVALLVVAYALSPIDLIPDFIPLLGYLDDLVIIPLGVFIVIRMIPPQVLADCRLEAAQQAQAGNPQYRWMAAIVILIWIILLAIFVWALIRNLRIQL
jgi:uncharacterized membrane protein YkvA (DUF1232 family)